ncbi:MAG: phenylalanine--tRNA ligase subunit beta, partial [Lachnospiraceae bacterium]|nr:phenylalanine--tRNA ligase subunit beta [Lachnospiraceae bacterium]
ENSLITDNVKTMLFEAACFDGTNIRLSSRKVGLRTDASAKFEKGLDPNNAIEAMNRACQLVEELGAGEVVGGVVDVYPSPRTESRIPFDADWINRLLGTDIPEETMLGYLRKIELGFDEKTREVIVPTWRPDLQRDADIAEEVARFYGYRNIPTTLPHSTTAGKLSYKLRIESIAGNVARFCGFSQAMTYSFESPKVFDKLLIPEDSSLRRAVVISNPLGEDFSIMKTQPVNGMLTSLATNYNRRNRNVRLYEIGNVYLPKQFPMTELPDERMTLTFGFYGEGDFYTMKGVVEELFTAVGMKKRPVYDPKAEIPYLHPGRQANVVYDGAVVAYLGEVHPSVSAAYGIKERVYIAVIDMPEIVSRAAFDQKYEGIARFPAVSRDLSLVVPEQILAGEIEALFAQRGGKMLENCELFDIYEGAQIRKGYKSLAYKLTFRLKDRTLEESDITAVMKKIMNGLDRMGIELRQ